MMETESRQIRSCRDQNEIGQHIANSPRITKHELETEVQDDMHLLEGIEFESTIIKIENSAESDVYPVENIVESELVEFRNNPSVSPPDMMIAVTEFRNNPSVSPPDMMIAVTLEKIPKTEAKFLDDEPSDDEDDCDEPDDKDPYGNVKYSDSDVDSDSDAESDPFADVDCDPCFSQKPPPQSDIQIGSAGQVESKNALEVNANASSNPPSSAKSVNKHREHKRFGKNLQCQLCHETEHSKSKLRSHLKVCEASHKNRRRFCELCNKLYSTTQGYRRHALRMHGINNAKIFLNSFKCQFCPRSFKREEYLILHAVSHRHPESSPANNDGGRDLKPRPFKCPHPDCPATFSNSGGLSNHLKSKKSERPFKCSQPNCEKAFKLSSHLKDHLRLKHSDERPFKCRVPNCDKSYTFKFQLHRHMSSHSEERPFVCPHADCSRAFKSKEGVTKHSQVHGGTEPYSHSNLPEGPFKCGQCGRSFYMNWHLTAHLRVVHPKDDEIFKCPEPSCVSTFQYKNSLRKHLAAYHTGKQTSFTCPEPNCSKSFKSEKRVQEHFKTHTRPHKCTQPGCSATFPKVNLLNVHIKSKHKNN